MMPDFSPKMTNEEMADAIFGSSSKPPLYDFNGHVVTIVLLRGDGEQPEARFECKEADNPRSPCQPDACAMKGLYDEIGWECFKAAGEIELVKLSARVDWSDPEEPWIEVEP